MPVAKKGAQRASGHRFSIVVVAAMAAVLAVGGLATHPGVAAAAGRKVVIVVGPTGTATANYIYNARKLAAQARSYGATVYEIYSPNATWSRVVSIARGANLFIYLGHGNGYPSPYGAFNRYSKDGMGLNPYLGSGNTSRTYYGEYYLVRDLRLAPNAVVILNRLCYASGNSEWGTGFPTKSVAMQRVDNYGAGFLRTGARAVFAEGIASASYLVYSLFRTGRSIKTMFWADPSRVGTYAFKFASGRTPGKTAILDPSSPGRYYRSVIGDLGMLAATWRSS